MSKPDEGNKNETSKLNFYSWQCFSKARTGTQWTTPSRIEVCFTLLHPSSLAWWKREEWALHLDHRTHPTFTSYEHMLQHKPQSSKLTRIFYRAVDGERRYWAMLCGRTRLHSEKLNYPMVFDYSIIKPFHWMLGRDIYRLKDTGRHTYVRWEERSDTSTIV